MTISCNMLLWQLFLINWLKMCIVSLNEMLAHTTWCPEVCTCHPEVWVHFQVVDSHPSLFYSIYTERFPFSFLFFTQQGNPYFVGMLGMYWWNRQRPWHAMGCSSEQISWSGVMKSASQLSSQRAEIRASLSPWRRRQGCVNWSSNLSFAAKTSNLVQDITSLEWPVLFVCSTGGV